MLNKKTLFPMVIVMAAILSLVLYSNIKGDKSMNDTPASNPTVMLETTMGDITIELDAKHAPISTANFLSYVDDGYFAGTTFHRVIPGFMIQGGGLTADMLDKPSKHEPIKNEANNGLKNDRGTLAMARTSDPHSATSQFFINHADNAFLNFTSETAQGWGYAVFGKVISGMDVVDSIAKVATGNSGGHQNVPVEPIMITSARRL